MKLARSWEAWKYAAPMKGRVVADVTDDGYEIQISRGPTRWYGRLAYWHHAQDVSREGWLLDNRISANSLSALRARIFECGWPHRLAVMAVSAAEDEVEISA